MQSRGESVMTMLMRVFGYALTRQDQPTGGAGNGQLLLALFDKSTTAARAALAGATDEGLAQTWSLLAGGQTILSMPRIACIRSFVMNHNIHHRAQLTVYLRLNDVPVRCV